MNPDLPPGAKPEDLETSLTALLLGELPEYQAAVLRLAIQQDPELSKVYERLKKTIEMVRETTAVPAPETSIAPQPLKLSAHRREKLLEQFKTVAPKEFARKPRWRIRPAYQVAAVAVLLACLGGLVLPAFTKAKSRSIHFGTWSLNESESLSAKHAASPADVRLRKTLPQNEWKGEFAVVPAPAIVQKPALTTTIVLPAGGKPEELVPGAQPVPKDGISRFGGIPDSASRQEVVQYYKPAGAEPQEAIRLLDDLFNRRSNLQSSSGLLASTDQGGHSPPAIDAYQGRMLFNSKDDAVQFAAKPASSAQPVPALGDLPVLGKTFRSEPVALDFSGIAGSNQQLAAAPPTETWGVVNGGAMAITNAMVPAPGYPQGAFAGGGGGIAGGLRAIQPLDEASGKSAEMAKNSTIVLPQGTEALAYRSRYSSVIPQAGRTLTSKEASVVKPSQTGEKTTKDDLAELNVGRAYVDAKRNLDELLRFRQILDLKMASESIDTSLPQQHLEETRGAIKALEKRFDEQEMKVVEARKEVERLRQKLQISEVTTNKETDEPKKARPVAAIPVPQPEVQTRDNAFSTFSLNVSDVSFKLTAASLEKGVLPEPANIRSEEFINAFEYRDPEPAPGAPIAFASDRARYPFAQNRDLLRFSVKTAAQGRQAGRPLNLVLLLDNSGSMERADRVRIIQESLKVLAAQLQPQDKFSIVTFARTARLWVDGVPGNQAAQLVEEVGKLTPQGGTNLEEAMNLAYQTALRHYQADGINRVVLLTDGAANLGDVDPNTLQQKVESHRKQGVALDCFGIGWEGYNDDLLEMLSRHGDGRYGFINTPEEAATEFAARLAGALRVAASDVKVQVEFNPNRVTAYRQIGYAKHQLTKEQFRDNTVDAAEIGAAESGNALYVIEVNPAGTGELATVRVRYKVPGTSDYREQAWGVPYSGNAPALEQASQAMRLATSASTFSEWLANSPFAAEVTPDRVLGYLSGIPEACGADARPKKLEWMIRQAKSLAK